MREVHLHGKAAEVAGACAHATPHRLDQATNDREADAGPRAQPAVGGRPPVEAPEEGV